MEKEKEEMREGLKDLTPLPFIHLASKTGGNGSPQGITSVSQPSLPLWVEDLWEDLDFISL